MKVKTLFILILFLIGISHPNFAFDWVRGEISFYTEISDGIIADLNKDGLYDILIISGRFIYIFYQTKIGFQEIPDDRIYIKQLGEFIDVGEINPGYQGLEILGLSEKGVKYFYLEGSNYKESPGYLFPGKIEKANYSLGPAVSDFAFDINNDGLDEIFLLHNNRFYIYSLDDSGKFVGTEIKHYGELITSSLESRKWPAEVFLNNDSDFGYLFRPKISVKNVVSFQDFNADNFLDLISGNIFLQKPNLQFESKNKAVEDNISFFNKEKPEILLDINGDGILDKILIEIKDVLTDNINIFPIAKIFIFLNKNNVFSSNPDYFLKTVLMNDNPPFADIDRDGDMDFISIWLDLSPGSKEDIIQVLTESTLNFTFRYYLFEKERGFSIDPDIIIKSDIKYSKLSDIGEHIRFDVTGDFNADGMNDLFIIKEPERMYIYFLDLEQKNNISSVICMRIPKEVEHFKLIDMNGDRKSDILLLTKDKIILYFSK